MFRYAMVFLLTRIIHEKDVPLIEVREFFHSLNFNINQVRPVCKWFLNDR